MLPASWPAGLAGDGMTVDAVDAGRDVAELVRTLEAVGAPAGLGRFLAAARALVAGWARDGPPVLEVGRLASVCHDALLARAAVLAGEGGLPPGCALAVLGSQGRREQFLATDQDNALILDDVGRGPGCL